MDPALQSNPVGSPLVANYGETWGFLCLAAGAWRSLNGELPTTDDSDLTDAHGSIRLIREIRGKQLPDQNTHECQKGTPNWRRPTTVHRLLATAAPPP